ncbi:hypothetical protein [Kaistella jeonii]|uniref:Photosynthesis system II assembly factor Ycf48/Hcf136-like domain-containing protein n=1 Tax=Kaistella jeonii TaxID=266749 RepID=A0A0C1CYS5_9FLAO|nr:hypothetical protein [Kaistella jeonii]KIA89581.1 hypothetical protein OA86_02795 [Kaistella jeonii]SFB90618.1 hypothetical protein SAMN05421876_103341 [Kaistella jeonii]VEI95786.1 Uncharacterised protein [Kaistella jeonii]
MSQIIKFKENYIRICSTNSSHLLQSTDRGKSWELLFDGTFMMNSIMKIACDDKIILLDSNKGYFISKSGMFWIKYVDLEQIEDLADEN